MFGDFAASLLERKVSEGEIKSEATIDKWRGALQTEGKKQTSLASLRIVPSLGSIACADLRFTHIDKWRGALARAVTEGKLSAQTANGWLSIVRVITAKMSAELESRDPCTGIANIKGAPVYTDDEPNALHPSQVRTFLDAMRVMYPMHYAMAALGFAERDCVRRHSVLSDARDSSATFFSMAIVLSARARG